MYVEHWTLKWSDLLLNRRKTVTQKGVWAFRNWIRQSVAANKPFNTFASELLTSGGSAYENPAANYFRIAREPKLVHGEHDSGVPRNPLQLQSMSRPSIRTMDSATVLRTVAYFADVGRRPLPDGDEFIFTTNSPTPVINPDSNQPADPKFPFSTPARLISARRAVNSSRNG